MAKLVMAERLAEFRVFDQARPWTPGGVVDCCLALAEWAKWLGHPDPAAHLRGIYEPGQGQLDILAHHGGALPLVERCALLIGGQRTNTPQVGAVGVVGSLQTPVRQFGVIMAPDGWITRTPQGWHGISARCLAAWRI